MSLADTSTRATRCQAVSQVTASGDSSLIGSRFWTFADETHRHEFLGVDPGASRLWLLAPPQLRRDYADGRIDEREFWRAPGQWLDLGERR